MCCVGGDGVDDGLTVSLYSAIVGEATQHLRGHTDKVVSVAIEGGLLASGGRDKTIRLWSSRSGRCLQVLSGLGGPVFGLALCGATMLSGEGSNEKVGAMARVWSLALDQIDQIELVGSVVPGAQGEETAPVEGGGGVASCIAACLEHRGNIWSCSLALPSEVQGVAVTAGHDATAKVWPMDGERLAALKQSTQQRRAPARLASLATLKVMLTPLSSPR